MTAPAVDAPASAPSVDPIQQAIANQRVAVETGTSAARLAPEGPLPPGVEIPTAPGTPSETPVEAAETPETPVEGQEAPPEVDPGPEPIVVALPARRPGEQDVEIEVTDPIVAERLRNMMLSYERKADSRQRYEAAQALRQEAEEFQTLVATNPAQVVQNTLDPERQKYLALQLVTEHWGDLSETLTAMLSDQTGQTSALIKAQLQAEALRLQNEAQQTIQTRRAADRNAKIIDKGIDAIIPPTLTGPQREAWKRDALNDLAQYVTQHNIQAFDPLHLPMVLAGRLRAWNTDPQQAAAHLYATLTGRQGAPGAHTASGSPPSPPTGPQLVRAAASRRAASAAAPSGAITPPASVAQMPKDIKTVDGAIAYRRQQLGLPAN